MDRYNIQLFDQFERNYLGLARYSEPRWQFLNRSSRIDFEYVRDTLEKWFENYDADREKRFKLAKAFRSDKDKEHLSAFFELYLYQLFIAQGFSMEIEPEYASRRRPDFLLTSPRGDKILLEATGVYPDRYFGAAKKQEQIVIDYLNDNLESPDFFLHIKILQSPQDNPPCKTIKRVLERKLQQLDYNLVMQDSLEKVNQGLKRFPSHVWKHHTWTIEFVFIPKQGGARGKSGVRPIGSWDYSAEVGNTVSYIRSAIDSKSSHYGEINTPYILAINVFDYCIDETTLSALIGDERVIVDFETKQCHPSRIPNGSWYGPNGYQKKRMSAACLFTRLRPETMHISDPVLWHHPYPTHQLNDDLFALNQQIVDMNTSSYKLHTGKEIADLLQINVNQMPK